MNVADNMLLLTQMFVTQGTQNSASSQRVGKQEDGSSFRDLIEQRQSSSRQPPSKSAQDRPKAEAPQDAPAKGTEGDPAPQTQTPEEAPPTPAAIPLVPQLTMDSAVQAAPQTPQAQSFVQTAQGQPQAQAQVPQQGRQTVAQPVQTQQPAQGEAQQVLPKAETTVDLTLAQTRQQGEQAGKNLLGSQTELSQSGKAVTVQQGEEAPSQPLFRQLEGTPVKVGEAQTADTKAPNFEQQLAKQIDTALEKGAQRIEIKLAPEHLGKLTIELTRAQDGSIRLVLHTATERAAALLSEHSTGLASLLRGSTQSSVQVEVQQQNQEHGQREEQQQRQGNPQQQQRQQEQQTQDFLQQLRLGILPLDGEAS